MNSFYILIYYEIFKDFEFIRFLSDHATVDSLKTNFSRFIVSQTLKSFQIENIILFSHLSQSVKELDIVTSVKQKYNIFTTIFQNTFVNEAGKSKTIDLFCKVQRRYMALCRFAYLWKLRKAETCVDCDLYLNAIEPTKQHSFVLFQTNKKYHFIISDLIKTLEYAVCHEWEDEFDIICKKPCNPYTKQPFLKHDLWNIYFHMRFKMDVVIPSFFHLWFLENFDLSTFLIKHRRLLRKICIKHHVFSVSNASNVICRDIRMMLFENKFTRKWLIHEEFPRDILIDRMRPYLYIFYLIHYDVLEYEELIWYEAVLTLELMKCYKYNPCFGRRTVKPRINCVWEKNSFAFENKIAITAEKSPVPTLEYVFNTKTLNFNSSTY